ncbi:MAG TPA: GntR family transcriptional regulator [Dehalococcoidia bacterium]|nr:GntR family transcriptional regulator [Dehalococcoidia bacterium]
MIEFYLDRRSGTSPYLQLVEQVKRALLLGTLQVGDQLPTMKEVVAKLTINPNTVLKAYRELEHDGLIEARQGVGTFIVRSLADPSLSHHPTLRLALVDWLNDAREAGLNEDSIVALFDSARRETLTGAQV